MKMQQLIFGCFLAIALHLPAQELSELVQEGEVLFKKTSPKLRFPMKSHFDSKQDFYTELDTSRSVNFLESELKKWQSQQS